MTPDPDFALEYLNGPSIPHALSAAANTIVCRALAHLAGDPNTKLWLTQRTAPVVFVGLDDAYTWHVRHPLPAGTAVVILGKSTLARPLSDAVAIVAHELGHVWLKDHHRSKIGQEEEMAADGKAKEWGFRNTLRAALQADVNAEADTKKRADLQVRVDALGP